MMSVIKLRAIQRGRLLERISQQRNTLAIEMAPVVSLLETGDQLLKGAEKSRQWIGENPIIAGASLLALVIWRPRGVLKLAKNGAIGWRGLRLIRRLLA